MFNSFEQGHSEWLEPEDGKVVGIDYFNDDIYEGDGEYWKDEQGYFIPIDRIDEYLNDFCELVEF